MAITLPSTQSLVKALESEGMSVPANCRDARLVMSADSAFVLQYEVLLTYADLDKIGRAIQRIALSGPLTASTTKG